MSRAAVIYRSRTGTTRRLAEEIGAYLATKGIDPSVSSVGECDINGLGGIDYLILGCWTNGWFVVHQHPDEPWLAFVRDLPPTMSPRVGLFTTYTLATGSMFARMRERLAGKTADVTLELKSRDGHLSVEHKQALDRFVGAA